MGSPEVPASNNDDVQQPPFNEGLILVDSDSEEEFIEENNGYTLLSQSAVDHHSDVVVDDGDSSSEEYLDAECEVPVAPDELNFDVGTNMELRELWSAPPPMRTDIDLGADKLQAVQEAMSGITLPASAIPEWAAAVPEDQWRQQILDRMQEFKAAK